MDLFEQPEHIPVDILNVTDGDFCPVCHYYSTFHPVQLLHFAGGRYVTVSGNIRKLDGTGHQIIMADGTSIPIDDVRFIEGSLFDAYEQY